MIAKSLLPPDSKFVASFTQNREVVWTGVDQTLAIMQSIDVVDTMAEAFVYYAAHCIDVVSRILYKHCMCYHYNKTVQ